jgi:hypothetical protein
MVKLKSFNQKPLNRAIRSAINTTVVSGVLLSATAQAQTFEFSANQDTQISQNNPNAN